MTQHGWLSDKIIYIPKLLRKERFASNVLCLIPRRGSHNPCASMLHENKGFDVLLEALAAVPDVSFGWQVMDHKNKIDPNSDNLKISDEFDFWGGGRIRAFIRCC